LKVNTESYEEGKLDGQGYKVGNDYRNRRDKTGKVDLAKEVGIVDKSIGSAGETIGEVMPKDGAGHVEEDLGETIGGQAGDVAKNDGENKGVEDRLNDQP